MTSIEDAKLLSHSITGVANNAGVNTQAIITDMNQVLGSTAGNALEMYETVKYLTGKLREPRLHQVVVTLATAMLINTNLAKNELDAHTQIELALSSGKAAEIFGKMISALGGPNDFIESPGQSRQRSTRFSFGPWLIT